MAKGRHRDGRVDAAVAEATRQVLAESGYARLTVDAVARRAGVGKAAIYRRFASRAEMVFVATVSGSDATPLPDAGSLHADLLALVARLLDAFGAPAARQAVPGLLADVRADPALAERFRTALVARERASVLAVLDRAVARGEVATRPDPQLVHALLLGPVFAAVFLVKLDPADLPMRLATVLADAFTAAAPPVPVGASGRVAPGFVVPS
jgi:AcrR family transcriptional regulator